MAVGWVRCESCRKGARDVSEAPSLPSYFLVSFFQKLTVERLGIVCWGNAGMRVLWSCLIWLVTRILPKFAGFLDASFAFRPRAPESWLGLCALKRKREYEIEERKEGKEKERRERKGRYGGMRWEEEQRGKERKRLVRVWWFWGTLRLLDS